MIMQELYGTRMALVIIDPQRKFMSDRPDWEGARDAAVSRMNRLLHIFRTAGAPIIVVQYEGETHCRPYGGTDGDEYFPGLDIRPCDTVVVKRNMNSFRDTNLEEVLRARGADMVLLCGTVTQYCVMSTYYAAMDRNIVPYLAAGATISTCNEVLQAAETVCKTLEEDVVCRHLGVPEIPEGEVPCIVGNVYPSWEPSMIHEIVALANSGGGHFVIGYPRGVKDRDALAEEIMRQASLIQGLLVVAEPIRFCSQDAVDVNVSKAESPVEIGGQRFVAKASYSY